MGLISRSRQEKICHAEVCASLGHSLCVTTHKTDLSTVQGCLKKVEDKITYYAPILIGIGIGVAMIQVYILLYLFLNRVGSGA